MKLCYRGVSYEYTPPTLKITLGEVVGKYRGLDVRSRNLATMPMEQPSFELQYRGVPYKTGSQVVAAQPAVVAASEPITLPGLRTTEKARSLMVKQSRGIKKRQQAMLSRLAGEVGLGSNVADYWNRIQGKIHPTFRISYDRSHVAFS
jgi:Domain of unknown function (DUF4278)